MSSCAFFFLPWFRDMCAQVCCRMVFPSDAGQGCEDFAKTLHSLDAQALGAAFWCCEGDIPLSLCKTRERGSGEILGELVAF